MNKEVLLPIEVCLGDYCWDHIDICSHFDNEGGHGHCDLDIGSIKRDEAGRYLKPDKCKNLKPSSYLLYGDYWNSRP